MQPKALILQRVFSSPPDRADMRIEVDPQLRSPLDDVVSVYAARKGLVLHLLSHTRHFNFCDLLRRFYQCACSQKASKFIAGKKDFIEVRHAGNA